MQTHTQHTNPLINESSPYLLQHAHNPVDWHPWNEEAFEKARRENKPVLVSIGYSACHWCHVMERECFENEKLAGLMNEHFVNIKVDREERPDIDQIYIEAVQIMGFRGGWPLNVFITPDGKPFYGGTYFPAENWESVLTQISNVWKNNPEKVNESAGQAAKALDKSDVERLGIQIPEHKQFNTSDIETAWQQLASNMDQKHGGMNRAPKFPLPKNFLFILRYWYLTKNEQALEQLKLTLDKMALGGIYDQIGGGFARYSTDEVWLVPHFEKMLYDNGQLLSLYAEAYTATREPLYKKVIEETIQFTEREMMDHEGGFYSALDADSEGEEGKFYVWEKQEVKAILGTDAEKFCNYYNISERGNWENGKNILNADLKPEDFAKEHNLNADEFRKYLDEQRRKLLKARSNRIRPALDDKILASWNGLMLNGIVDAYRALEHDHFLDIAEKNANFLINYMKKGMKLYHKYKNGEASVNGYLEDYATVAEALINLYEATFEEKWLYEANELIQYAIEHFYDKDEGYFYFTADNSEQLIVRKKELLDNVVPASNSVMAHNLFRAGILMDEASYRSKADAMLAGITGLFKKEPGALANWGILLSNNADTFYEIAITGKEANAYRAYIDRHYKPNKIFTGTETESELPLLKDREKINDQTTIYVCVDQACQLPVNDADKAIEQME